MHVCTYVYIILTDDIDSMCANHVLSKFRIRRVADNNDASTLVIYTESHIRSCDPTTLRRRFCFRRAILKVPTVYRPLYIRRWV